MNTNLTRAEENVSNAETFPAAGKVKGVKGVILEGPVTTMKELSGMKTRNRSRV